jgi:hypothetical protein
VVTGSFDRSRTSGTGGTAPASVVVMGREPGGAIVSSAASRSSGTGMAGDTVVLELFSVISIGTRAMVGWSRSLSSATRSVGSVAVTSVSGSLGRSGTAGTAGIGGIAGIGDANAGGGTTGVEIVGRGDGGRTEGGGCDGRGSGAERPERSGIGTAARIARGDEGSRGGCSEAWLARPGRGGWLSRPGRGGWLSRCDRGCDGRSRRDCGGAAGGDGGGASGVSGRENRFGASGGESVRLDTTCAVGGAIGGSFSGIGGTSEICVRGADPGGSTTIGGALTDGPVTGAVNGGGAIGGVATWGGPIGVMATWGVSIDGGDGGDGGDGAGDAAIGDGASDGGTIGGPATWGASGGGGTLGGFARTSNGGGTLGGFLRASGGGGTLGGCARAPNVGGGSVLGLERSAGGGGAVGSPATSFSTERDTGVGGRDGIAGRSIGNSPPVPPCCGEASYSGRS